MSKRYSGKSFKDSSVKKKPKLSLKKKENLNAKSEKIQIRKKISNLLRYNTSFFKFSKVIKYV